MAASEGLPKVSNVRKTDWPFRAKRTPPSSSKVANCLISAPAQKDFPSPLNNKAFTFESFLLASKTDNNSSINSAFKAFSADGRFKMISKMPELDKEIFRV